jgi:regulator of protease activity HflC (stomatin/prohibitin superfamily)
MSQTSREVLFARPRSGLGMLLLGILLLLAVLPLLAYGAHLTEHADTRPSGIALCILAALLVPTAVLVFKGLVLVNPNQSKVVLLFGRYRGTIRSDGFFWVNPFTVRRTVSLRAHNFNSEKLKVNDLRGNPIEIGAVVVWRVRDTAQALFDVENYDSYVEVQTESALRHLATCHPYDVSGENAGQTSLRGSSDAVNAELQAELTNRLAMAGIDILEARLSHLAYAPEIAGAMLQRQQAEAIIDARRRIVDGAVGMVQMALEMLKEQRVLDLDEERKAQMVSNLLVVLCSERGSQPVINAGTLYG